jgi:hypothetical protein
VEVVEVIHHRKVQQMVFQVVQEEVQVLEEQTQELLVLLVQETLLVQHLVKEIMVE